MNLYRITFTESIVPAEKADDAVSKLLKQNDEVPFVLVKMLDEPEGTVHLTMDEIKSIAASSDISNELVNKLYDALASIQHQEDMLTP